MADFDRAIDVCPNIEDAYLERGKLKLDDDNLGGALLDFSYGLSINSKSWGLYSHRANVFSQLAKSCSMKETSVDSENEFSLLGIEDRRSENFYFKEEMSGDISNDEPFVPHARLRQCK